MYYANRYPEEVKAIIGIDSTLPQALEYFGETVPTMPKYLSYVAPTGIARLALYLTPDNFLPISEKGTEYCTWINNHLRSVSTNILGGSKWIKEFNLTLK